MHGGVTTGTGWQCDSDLRPGALRLDLELWWHDCNTAMLTPAKSDTNRVMKCNQTPRWHNRCHSHNQPFRIFTGSIIVHYRQCTAHNSSVMCWPASCWVLAESHDCTVSLQTCLLVLPPEWLEKTTVYSYLHKNDTKWIVKMHGSQPLVASIQTKLL